MNNIINALNQFAQNEKICAVYFQSFNGLNNLKFHYLEKHQDKWSISSRILNDDKFFQQLYKNEGVSKNELLGWIHQNVFKEKYLHLQSNVDIIITKELK